MSRKVATVIELAKLLLLRTAFSFSSCPAGAVTGTEAPKSFYCFGAAGFWAGALLAVVVFASVQSCGHTDNPRWTVNSMARSIGMCATPAFLSTQP
jgi:putative copper export protein